MNLRLGFETKKGVEVMKIQDGKNIRQAIKPESQNKIDKKGDAFKKILSGIQSKVEGTREKKPLSADEIQKINLRLHNASTISRLEASSFSESIGKFESGEIEKVEQFLDLLESYAQALSDPKKNLRDIAPLIKSLESEKGKLAELGEKLPDENILKDVVNQTAILATVEVLKFNRGNYL